MNRNYFLIIAYVALFCLLLIFVSLWWQIRTPVVKENPIETPKAPFKSYISGVGIVEASSDNILISTPLNRIVEKVLVTVGQRVKKGDVLIQLEDRDLKANLAEQQAAYNSSVAKLQRLEAFPRPEDVEAATAAVKKAQAELDFAKQQYDMVLQLNDPRAISEEERKRRQYSYQLAETNSQHMQAELTKIKAGTWKPDLEIARQEVALAKANINRIETDIQRTVIRSPIDGVVLQIKVNAGEVASMDSKTPMMILGNTDELYLRVSINQLDIPFFKDASPAVAFPQGDASVKFPLEFVRVEPFLVSKSNLTNRLSEKVDTRVLQIIYRINADHQPIYVEQQMDVFIEAKRS